MNVQDAELHTLPVVTSVEVLVRERFARSSLLALGRTLREELLDEGAAVHVGRLERVHRTLVQQILDAPGVFASVGSSETPHRFLVHADAEHLEAFFARLTRSETVLFERLTRASVRTMLSDGRRVALLPVEVQRDGSFGQLRFCFFPDDPTHPGPRVTESFDEVPIVVSILAGRAALSLRELRSLERGDAVFVEEDLWPGRCLARLPGDADDLLLSLHPDGLIYTERRARPRPDAQRERMTEPHEALGPLEDVELELTFEVGTTTRTIGELAALTPGVVLVPQTTNEDGTVLVRANGRAFATGTLVRLDGALAVRIDALGPAAQ